MKENIEEAIDRLEYVNRAYDCNNYYSRYDLDCIQILLSDYKRVLKINEVLLKENEELHKEIDRMKSLDIYKLVEDWETGQLIPIQKIKDKIKELNSRIEIYWKYVEQGVDTDVEWVDNVADRETVKVLQELIEER